MKEIELTQGKITVVDDDMFEELNKYKWFCNSEGYAIRSSSRSLGKQKAIRMHRVICNTPEGMETDHISGDKLDNQRANLRICTMAENQRNSGKPANNTSGFKGVLWRKQKKKWQARIRVDKKSIHLGYFEDILVAARAYDEAARQLHGAFAKINFEVAA